jgi:5-methylcytosine-specific restriction enzyme subunit McrC
MTWTADSPLVLEAYNDASLPQTLTDEEVRYLTDGIETQYREQNSQRIPSLPVSLRRVAEGTEIRSNGYTGTIKLPSGRVIELRPSMSARNILRLLKYAYDLNSAFVSEPTSWTSGDVTLNAFTALYLAELRDLIDGGLHPGYRRVERSRRRLRGCLDIQQQLHHQQQQQTQFPVRFESTADELTYDTPLNRAVYHATKHLAVVVDNTIARRELRTQAQILRRYVSTDPISTAMIESIDLSRLEGAYDGIYPLMTSILRGQYLGREAGTQRAYCLLVKAWKVFQQATEAAFRAIEQRRNDITLETQVTIHDPTFIDGDQFIIRPDFILRKDGTPVLVADTKWKPRGNAAIYQIVTYQMILDTPGLLLYPEEIDVNQRHDVDGRHSLRLASLPTATEAISYEAFVREIEQTLEREIDRLLDS